MFPIVRRLLLSTALLSLACHAQGLPALPGIPSVSPQTTDPAQPPAPPPPPPKPAIADIPEHLNRSLAIIRRITQDTNVEQTDRIRADLKEVVAASETIAGLKNDFAAGGRARSGMQLLKGFWKDQNVRLNDWQSLVARNNQSFDQDLKTLDTESRFFADITKEMDQQKIQTDLRGVVTQVQSQIQIATAAGRKRQTELLNLQADLTGAQIDVRSAEDYLQQVSMETRARLLTIDSPPIWAAGLSSVPDRPAAPPVVHSAPGTRLVASYLIQQSLTLAALYALVLFPLLYIRRRAFPALSAASEASQPVREVLQRPYGSALLPALIFAPLVRGQVQLDSLFLLIPLIRLLPRLVPANLTSALAGIGALFAVESIVIGALRPDSVWSRWLHLILIALAGSAVWFFLAQLRVIHGRNWLTRLWERGGALCLVLLAVAFAGDVAGATELSQYLQSGVVKTLFAATILYGFFKVSHALLQTFLGFVPNSPTAALVWTHEQLSARLTSLMQWSTGLYFSLLLLNIFQLSDWFFDIVRSILAYQISIGSIAFSIGSICIIVLTLSFAGLLSRIIRFGLAVSLFDRVAMPQGTVEVISKLVHYTLITAAFLIAMSAAGIDLTRFTILMGALGVGIGFGLQNVVNNFICGLILLFERPITVGDTIKVGDVTGTVTDIGIRSTRVQTWDGADIPVPNANLLSSQFTNWHGLAQRRGAELTIRVAAGVDPSKVIHILEETAINHPAVLSQPAPTARFERQGENAMEFVLRYWALVRDVSTANNDMYVEIFQKLSAEGIQLPVPQRELRVSDITAIMPPKS